MRPNLKLIKDRKDAPKLPPSKPKGECPRCKGSKTSSFMRGETPWKKCLECTETWGLGGNMNLLAKTGQDRHDILRDLLQEQTLISVTEECQRNVNDWEQDLEVTERNDSLYHRF